MRVRRVGAPYAPHFAWFLHGFCMNIETCHFDMLVFCTVLHGFCMWNSLFFSHVEQLVFLHDMWNSLHVFLHDTNSFFRMTRTACTVLHGFCMHVAQPRAPPPVFFLSGCRRSDILENLAVGRRGGAERAPVTKCAEQAQCRAGTVPSGHLTKRAEQAQCRAGT